MDKLKTPVLVPIKAVPDLFIADRFAASSKQQLQVHNIVRILSVLQPHETSRSLNSVVTEGGADQDAPNDRRPEIKTIDLNDDPLEDILQHLQEACDWIQNGLDSQELGADRTRPGVLVHCRQGISRSGSFIVAFLMRKNNLSYASGLNLARESRPQITPNNGFEKQLRIWEFCKYEIYVPASETGGERKEKPPYKAWKAERDNLLSKGEEDVNRARFSSLADMAARFGWRRQDVVDGEERTNGREPRNEDHEEGLGKGLGQYKRKEAWERVQMMEKEWNERLVKGQVGGG
ncbi:hypothetical protein H2200_005543 [Cladophialophora chaetospira]|uniref:protein-tyrosine-phosphatase n=1 Tax=Cladophialophora chaetospira TaxID=386627 RepID=A0AA38XCS6_9EURO|nr:hypothetical protein H2200_005543 [Cladophialophora chaetospira]